MSESRDLNDELAGLLDHYNAKFLWDGVGQPHTWRLVGPRCGSGRPWETDGQTAATLHEAHRAAVAYLRASHGLPPDHSGA